MKEGNVTEANRLSKLAMDYFPDNAKVLKQQYAISIVDQVKREQAMQSIRTLYEGNKENIAFGELYAEVLLDNKKYKEASKVLNAYPVSIKLPKKLWHLKVFAQRNINNGEPLISMLELWSKTNPYHVEPMLLLVDFYVKSKNVGKALSIIEGGLTAKKASNTLLKIAKMQILLDGKELTKAKNFFNIFIADGMNETIVGGVKGRILLLENKFVEATPLLSSFYSGFPSSQAAILLAISHKGEGHTEGAITALKSYLNINVNDDNVRSLLASLYLEKEPEKSIPLYERMLLDQPNNVVFLNNLAWLNLESGNLESALKYSAAAVKLAAKHPNVLDTRGMVLLKSGKKRLALKALSKAYDISKGQDLNISINYAEVLISNDRNQKALSILKFLNGEGPEQQQRIKTLTKLAK